MHTGQTQFPNIFVGKEHIGSYDDLKSYALNEAAMNILLLSNGIYESASFDQLSISPSSDEQDFERGHMEASTHPILLSSRMSENLVWISRTFYNVTYLEWLELGCNNTKI